jgi:hypothetical protein
MTESSFHAFKRRRSLASKDFSRSITPATISNLDEEYAEAVSMFGAVTWQPPLSALVKLPTVSPTSFYSTLGLSQQKSFRSFPSVPSPRDCRELSQLNVGQKAPSNPQLKEMTPSIEKTSLLNRLRPSTPQLQHRLSSVHGLKLPERGNYLDSVTSVLSENTKSSSFLPTQKMSSSFKSTPSLPSSESPQLSIDEVFLKIVFIIMSFLQIVVIILFIELESAVYL